MKAHNKKPCIAITGPEIGGRVVRWFTALGVILCGGIPCHITAKNKNQSLEKYKGFIIAGGKDINPLLYNETTITPDFPYDTKRDQLEVDIIQYAIQQKVPILGICRGMQMLNVVLGGSLYQEAKDVLEDFLPSNNLLSKIVGRRSVIIDKKSQLLSILGSQQVYKVNSIHHQAIRELGRNLKVVAKEKNNLIQAIEKEDKYQHPFILGVQWHPEFMLHTKSNRNLFKRLITAHTEKEINSEQ